MQSYIGVEDNFLLENGYLIARLEEIVLAAEELRRFTPEDINEIFRIMHTIKSSAGIMMYENISILAHKLEDVFYCLRENYPEAVPHDELVEGILSTADFITGELMKIKAGAAADGDAGSNTAGNTGGIAAGIINYLDQFLNKIKELIKADTGAEDEVIPVNTYTQPKQFYVAPKAGEVKKYFRIAIYYRLGTEMSNVRAYSAVFALKPIAAEMIYTPPEIIDDNDTAGTIMREGFHIQLQTKCSPEKLRELVAGSSGEKEIEITDSSVEEFLRGFPETGSDYPVIRLDDDWLAENEKTELVPGAYVIQKDAGKGKSLAGNRSALTPPQDMLSIPLEKMDKLEALVGELTVMQEAAGAETVTELSRLIERISETVQSMQKVSFKVIAHQMNRAIYDISRKLNKVVELETVGDNVEIDRNIIGLLSDGLMHILRNAVDHGIEDKRVRLEHGKTAKGKILMTAAAGAAELCITVSDDGKGIDADQVFAEAVRRKLTGGRARQSFTAQEIYRFILQPGFSTNRQVTEYSGRGVGLDVVEQNLKTLDGRLEVDSQPGEGTTMTLWIPARKKRES